VARAARRAGFSRVVFRAGRSKCGLGLQAARVASSARRHGARGHGAPRGFLNRFNNPARRAASPFAFPFRPQKMHTSRGSGVAGRCHAQRAPNGCLAARTGFRLQLDTISGSSASCCRAAYSPFSSAECALFCSRSWSFVDSGFREQNDKGQQLKFKKPLWPCSVCARFLRAVLSLVCIAGTDRLNLTCEFGVAGVLDVLHRPQSRESLP
jgi:hypothetical protein